jgi:AraC-like DNA-binding protein
VRARSKLQELLLVEVLRLHLLTAPAAERGWLAALRDPVLRPALAMLHVAPERKWTVPELAAGAAVSGSLLDSRFRQVLGLSPIQYLTDWRMHIAQEMLATTETTVSAIAHRVGYESEEAFSRAFKRFHGIFAERLALVSFWSATVTASRYEGPGFAYISDPGVVSSSPVSSQVFRPERIIGQPP